MERINKLYHEVKDISQLKQDRINKLNSIKSLESELFNAVESLKNTTKKQKDVNHLEQRLLEIEKEIDHLSIKMKTITSLDDLMAIKNKELFKYKSFEFINELVYDWVENEEQTIVISKDTVPFFKRMKGEMYYQDLKNKYYERAKEFFKGVVYNDLSIEEMEKEYYFNVTGKPIGIKKFYDKNKELCNFLYQILSDNLEERISDEIKKRKGKNVKTLSDNNNLISGTKFVILNEREYLEKIYLNIIDSLCILSRKDIKIDLDSGDANFSEEFAILIFCFENLTDKSKIYHLNSLILEFFKLSKIEKTLFGYICIFTEMDFLIKKYNFTYLLPMKEEFFCEILKISGANEINLRMDFETIKNDIYQNQYAFKETVDLFLDDNYRVTFIISYFDLICDILIKYLILRESISIQESEGFCDLINFIFELSGIEKMLNNCDKLRCIEMILSSGLMEIEKYYQEKRLCLEKKEIIKLICALFTDTERRKEVVRKIEN